MRRNDKYDTIRATELEAAVAALGRGGRTRADYTHGASVRTTYYVASGRILAIGLINSGVDRLPTDERDALLERIGNLGLDWLRAKSLAVPGTLVSISLTREVDLKLVSWGWGAGGQTFWVDDRGELTTMRPASPGDERV